MSGGHGSLRLHAADGVKVYCVSGGKRLPEWVNEKKERKRLRKDAEYRCPTSSPHVASAPRPLTAMRRANDVICYRPHQTAGAAWSLSRTCTFPVHAPA